MRFAEDVESLGAHLDVSSDAFLVDVEAHALSRDTKTVLEAIAEMLRKPAFAPEELEKVKTEIAAEIRQRQDSPSDRSFERLTQLVLTASSPYYKPAGDAQLAAAASGGIAHRRYPPL